MLLGYDRASDVSFGYVEVLAALIGYHRISDVYFGDKSCWDIAGCQMCLWQ